MTNHFSGVTLASLPLQALVVGKLLLLKKLLLEGGDKMMVVIMMDGDEDEDEKDPVWKEAPSK